MKKQWLKPNANVQEFIANEYVAACTWIADCNVKGYVIPDSGSYNRNLMCDPCHDHSYSLDHKPTEADFNAGLDTDLPGNGKSDERIIAWGSFFGNDANAHGARLSDFSSANGNS